MSPKTARYVLISRFRVGDRKEFLCSALSSKEAAIEALAHEDPMMEMEGWAGEVFFDHLNGLQSESVGAGPLFLVTHVKGFDYASRHWTDVRPFNSVDELAKEAQHRVDVEKSAGPGVSELWEVYGVRILEASGSPSPSELV